MARTAKVVQSHKVACSDPACKTEALIDVFDCGCKSVQVYNAAPKPHRCVAEFELMAALAKGCKVHTKRGLIRKTLGAVGAVASVVLTIVKIASGG